MMHPIDGLLFSESFLSENGPLCRLHEWTQITPSELDEIVAHIEALVTPVIPNPGEAETVDEIIMPILKTLGWSQWLKEQNLSTTGRDDVPDLLLFTQVQDKDRARNKSAQWERYQFGSAVMEAKRWALPLDRHSQEPSGSIPPSSQILRYVRRTDDLTHGRLRWGLLTNGGQWRLYYAGAQSVSEQFCGIDLVGLFQSRGENEDTFRHWMKVFVLIFGRQAFCLDEEGQPFHKRLIDEGQFEQKRITDKLSGLVFDRVFPTIVSAIASVAPSTAAADDIRDAALTFLFRLLFVLYAEDRGLLPIADRGYQRCSLRELVRLNIRDYKETQSTFSRHSFIYWPVIANLFRLIDEGDTDIGLPPYNGGLFMRESEHLLERIELPDYVLANVVDDLSFEKTDHGRHYINYRDLSVQQLGSIYERLLEQQLVRTNGRITITPQTHSRKDSGTYYTPDELVALIIETTLAPLVQAPIDAFAKLVVNNASFTELERFDPATQLLELKVCDPAMGSGHFLVRLVDYLSDCVIEAMAAANSLQSGYTSPLIERIATIRATIHHNARKRGWVMHDDHLDDRHIVRRMVLKQCVYGVDRNPMAVELAKLSLWLHTFTVGAPLSFLDHHLRVGDSLFGRWVSDALNRLGDSGPLLTQATEDQARASATDMREVASLTDVDITEVRRSEELFQQMTERTAPIDAFLSLQLAFDWMDYPVKSKEQEAIQAWLYGLFGDPLAIATGSLQLQDPPSNNAMRTCFITLLKQAQELITSMRFLHWETAFPHVWSDHDTGGFDAVIGNPPWDRMKLQQVEWFSLRRPDIANADTAAQRQRMIAALIEADDPLAREYQHATQRATAAARMARQCGDYPLLSAGDVNLYSLFVERSMALVKPGGMMGLLVPSGIASGELASRFFSTLVKERRLLSLYDFENGRSGSDRSPFFPDVHKSFKFCLIVASSSPWQSEAQVGYYLQGVDDIHDHNRCFSLAPSDLALVNPNTQSAPVFRSRQTADLVKGIYRRIPVLVNKSGASDVKSWPVKYFTMFHMTNDSGLFRTQAQLEEDEQGWPISSHRFDSPSGVWMPLYEGKMINAFDHRAASIEPNPKSLHGQARVHLSRFVQHSNPDWYPSPRYWVNAAECQQRDELGWVVGLRSLTGVPNKRTVIAAILPEAGYSNSLPILRPEGQTHNEWLLCANLNSIILDFVARTKIHGNNLNKYILDQLPLIPPETYETTYIGSRSALEIAREAVIALTYTAHDMASFAQDLNYVDAQGKVLPPVIWDIRQRAILMAQLDALYCLLYGVYNREDIRYIYSTFPIVEREDNEAWGGYLSRDLCLMWLNALLAGNSEMEVVLPEYAQG